jgi:hypothetical protein
MAEAVAGNLGLVAGPRLVIAEVVEHLTHR